MGLIRGFVTTASDRQPTEKGFHKDGEEEWGKGVPLECASMYVEGGGVSVDGHVVCVRGGVELFACRDI